MNKSFRRIVAVALVLALSILGTGLPSPAFAVGKGGKAGKNARKDNTQAVGQLVVVGSATINGKKAISGTTVFNENRIEVACANGNEATVNLDKLGRVELGPGAEIVLRLADGLISGELLAGKAVINNTAGVKVAVNTPEGLAAADGQEASTTVASAQKGTRCAPASASSSSSSSGLGTAGVVALLGGIAAAGIGVGLAATDDDDPIVSSPLPGFVVIP